jgi:hypothetical protein
MIPQLALNSYGEVVDRSRTELGYMPKEAAALMHAANIVGTSILLGLIVVAAAIQDRPEK